jgi:hypothetical protein
MKNSLLTAAVCIPLCTSTAFAQWSENFDSYAASSQIVGQGGWEEWATGAGANVSNARARSGANSVEITGPSDLVHQYGGYATGKWIYRAWQYVPSTQVGMSYFILLNQYAYPSGPYSWSVQVGFDPAIGVRADAGGSPAVITPLIMDQWVELKVVIDLDYDWCQFFYNNMLLDNPTLANHPVLGGGYQWTGTVFGGGSGVLSIAAVDLYANSTGPVYYDDITIEQFVYDSLGNGCPGSMGPITFTMLQPPAVGGTFLAQIGNLPLSMCFHILGLSNQSMPLGSLPMDLTSYGMPGCNLYVSIDSTLFLPGGQNMTVFAWPLPSYPPLVGMHFYQQVLAPDPLAGNARGAVLSDGMVIKIQ